VTDIPIQLSEPVEVTWTLDDVQRARAFAVSIAKPLLTSQGLASKTPPDVNDLIRLAQWLLDGETEDLYPYSDSDGTVHLGPKVWMKPEGFLWVNGNLYEPAAEDGHDDD
jgi:hypothetical protein